MTPSRKRQKTTPADGDTRVVVVVKHRCTGQRVTPTSSQDYYCDSPPANQEALAELPWGPVELLSDSDSDSETVIDDGWTIRTPPHYYDDVDEDAIASSPAYEKENDDNFTFSPASPPPLTQSTHEDMTIPRLYVFPDETVVVTADGEHIRIPDQNTKTHPMMITQSTSTVEDAQSSTVEDPKPSTTTTTIEDPKPSTTTTIEDPKPSTTTTTTIEDPKPSTTTTTIEDPKPSTSTSTEEEEDPRKVCFLEMQNNIAGVIVTQWRASAPSTVEEVTVDVCRSLAVTMLSAPYQEIIMKYVRCAIRRQP